MLRGVPTQGTWQFCRKFWCVGASLNLSKFVDGCSKSMMEGVCVQNTLLFSRDWIEIGEETHLVSGSVYALEIAIN